MGNPQSHAASDASGSHYHSHKVFLLCNYILLGAASSCIFLTLSLRLIPSPCGLLLIFLHALTIVGAATGCAASPGSTRWHATHMVATVLTAIFQGSVALLVFTRTSDFLGELRSYVREEDGEVILKMVGALGAAIFCLEWVALALAFVLSYHAHISKVRHEDEETKDRPWPFQV
ncbi:uncharacterized protein LOC103706049 [Phoenix dactylifera]|uniref:Uncharacterized protein LOC103706049 n=1 Tax=Phoenix dactylifera TaxID=42345 RepID=A0A8B8ZAB7_PHODC|nr:uncharacterized protein LOC103706049 [Phoenix dactylifera]